MKSNMTKTGIIKKALKFIKDNNLEIIPIRDCVAEKAFMICYDLREEEFVIIH